MGEKGFVTSILPANKEIDTFYACGPLPMLKAVSVKLQNVSGFLSLEERMGCGIGACMACMIPANNDSGYKKICQDGPVFSAKEVCL
ncbi:hypothetical protein P5G51_011580 [Virgibacillus sp. 179-BFC.A HS]|uniref:Dihydroorotate dehydrogenase electron transfer subunit iron-sulphur cluster binding domain-containing protein n=1 Tax=Tigheibacillus jepli TaxID=3035914 RepID=A0ABU5CHZ7_9BACI|nr:hypothetical protein [Virgibacillus sp. 179-BFC.A HS]MDY0405945.1 hypothetical protein [Virgibacillus sp. 179-BFC.A HS]